MRFLSFALIAAVIVLAPAYRQVLGGDARWVRKWTMFARVGGKLCKGRWERELTNGETERLDVATILRKPQKAVRVTSVDDAVEITRDLCAQLHVKGEPPRKITVRLQCPGPRGWDEEDLKEDGKC